MRTIVLFNDGSAEAANAAQFALHMARRTRANLLILTLYAADGQQPAQNKQADIVNILYEALADADFKPVITDIDACNYSEKEIREMIISKNAWLMVKGIEKQVTHEVFTCVDIQSVLNHVACPLLLVPNDYAKQDFGHIVYPVDMRYCRGYVLAFLAELARIYNSGLVIEHVSAKDLPDLDEAYARSLLHRP